MSKRELVLAALDRLLIEWDIDDAESEVELVDLPPENGWEQKAVGDTAALHVYLRKRASHD